MSTIKPQYWALVIIVLIGLWIGSGIFSKANESSNNLDISENDNDLNETLPLVRYDVMKSKNYYSDFKILATTQAKNKIEIKSETDGVIFKIPYPKGSFVTKGSVICELEVNDRQEIFNMTLAKLENMEAKYQSSEIELLNFAKANLKNMETKYQSSEIELLNFAKANLKNMETKYQSSEIELLNSAKAKVKEAENNYLSSKKLIAKGYAPKNDLITKKLNLETAKADLKKAENEIVSRKANLESAKADLKKAENEIVSRKANLESAKADLKKAENEITTRKANLESAKAELKKAQIELNRIKIKAPFTGIIDDINPKVGELVTKGSTCAKLIDNNPMLVIGNISERNIDKLKIGMPVDIKLITNKILKGKINFISSSAEPNTRTFLVEAIVNNKDYKIKDGITAEIIVTIKSELAHKFSPAILSLNDNGIMGIKTINKDNLVEFFPVDIVNLDDNGAVATNLPAILKVITVGQDYVNIGQKVKPVQYNIEQNE